jgi:REP element-mobilizing transposase RayT
LFGAVVDAEMRFTEYGKIGEALWLQIPLLRPNVTLDSFVIMPNHMHGLLVLTSRDEREHGHYIADTDQSHGLARGSVGAIIGQYKSAVTKRVNTLPNAPGVSIWQRNYHEHIVRSDKALQQIREYVTNNPAQWQMDSLHPANAHMCSRGRRH